MAFVVLFTYTSACEGDKATRWLLSISVTQVSVQHMMPLADHPLPQTTAIVSGLRRGTPAGTASH